ncbi:hypothetical protein HZB02_02080 [Candidatus Woesearchaeota archaeon]|nr:hypothetical protein [Candidatus Woesearchaeota archaeon]
MDFNIQERKSPTKHLYAKEDIDLAYEFTKKVYQEYGKFISAVILFGSTARNIQTPQDPIRSKAGDIDIMIIVNDTATIMTPELSEAYRLITEKMIVETSKRLHVMTLRLTSFWEYVRAGDPIAINILRDGLALIDTGIFDPLQILLHQGKIRPTKESVWVYYAKAPRTLNNAKGHIIHAVLDLYWAVIDSAHAALMSVGQVPPTPSHVADMMEHELVKNWSLERKYVGVMRKFYSISKAIGHGEINEIKGREFDDYAKEAREFVERMKKIITRKEMMQ